MNLHLIAGTTMEDITMNEYLANEQAKVTMRNYFPVKKLWSLENDDEESEMYKVNLDRFPAIHPRKDSWDKEHLSPIFNDTYDAIICNLKVFSHPFELKSHITTPACSLATNQKEFDILAIDADLFTWETPLERKFREFKRLSSMEIDLFTYNLLMS